MVRLGLVGAGVIGKRHIAAIRNSGAAELVGIADPSPIQAGFAEELSVELFSDTGDMMQNRSPDGVIVATPTEHHLQPALSAIAGGAHVLVEKPVTATMTEAEQLIEAAVAAGRHVLVGHHRRYYECVRKARDIVHGGEIGKLVGVVGQWTVRKHDDYYKPDWRKKRAAGPVLTNLIHDIDSLRAICGEIVSICGETGNPVQGFEKEDVAAIVMRFANDALGTFLISDQAATPWGWEFGTGENPAFPRSGENSIRFIGTEGAFEFPNLKCWRSTGDRPDWNTPMAAQTIESELGDAFVAQINHFCQVIRGEADPLISAAEGARSLAATVAVFEAAENGRRVML